MTPWKKKPLSAAERALRAERAYGKADSAFLKGLARDLRKQSESRERRNLRQLRLNSIVERLNQKILSLQQRRINQFERITKIKKPNTKKWFKAMLEAAKLELREAQTIKRFVTLQNKERPGEPLYVESLRGLSEISPQKLQEILRNSETLIIHAKSEIKVLEAGLKEFEK